MSVFPPLPLFDLKKKKDEEEREERATIVKKDFHLEESVGGIIPSDKERNLRELRTDVARSFIERRVFPL